MHQVVSSPRYLVPCPAFSQGVLVPASGAFLFVSGVTPRTFDGSLVGDGDIEAQAHQVFGNLEAIVVAAGGTLNDVVKITCFVRYAEHMPIVTMVRRKYLPNPAPASTVIEVQRLFDDRQLLEVEAIAALRQRDDRPEAAGLGLRSHLVGILSVHGYVFDGGAEGPGDTVRGWLPEGSQSLVELAGEPVTAISLLLAMKSGSADQRMRSCLIELSGALSLDLDGSIKRAIRCHDHGDAWTVDEDYGEIKLILDHIPPDALIVSITGPS